MSIELEGSWLVTSLDYSRIQNKMSSNTFEFLN